MSKVLIDRELLERAVSIPTKESLEANQAAIVDRGRAQSDILELLTLPAEAEGAGDWSGLRLAAKVAEEDGPWEPRLCMTNVEKAFAQSASPTKVLELIAALSAVTAGRDRLREQVAALQSGANSWQSGYDKGREDGAKSAGGWKDQHVRDSAELRRLCAERDQLRQHKNDYMDAAEGTRKALIAEVEALRKDAERLDWLDGYIVIAEHEDTGKFTFNSIKGALRECVDAAMAAKESTHEE